MKKFHTGKRILTLFMPGFLFGIIYTNFIARQYVAEPEVFSDYFLQQFLQTRIVAQEFIWYVLKVRAIPFAVLLGLAFTKMRKMICCPPSKATLQAAVCSILFPPKIKRIICPTNQ